MITTSDSQALTSFTLFPNLPAELQIQIWYSAISLTLPQIICPTAERRDAPTVLQVCKLSREQALRKYDFICNDPRLERPQRYDYYFDYSKDYLYFNFRTGACRTPYLTYLMDSTRFDYPHEELLHHNHDRIDFDLVEKIAVWLDLEDNYVLTTTAMSHHQEGWWQLAYIFPNLKEMAFVLNEAHDKTPDHLEVVDAEYLF